MFSSTTLHRLLFATAAAAGCLLAAHDSAVAFAPASVTVRRSVVSVSVSALSARNGNSDSESQSESERRLFDRRECFSVATKAVVAGAAALATSTVEPASAAAGAGAPTGGKVVVAGATGQTGRRVLDRLAQAGNLEVVGGVRNVEKARESLSESSTVVRGAMVQRVASVDASSVDLRQLDVVRNSVDELAAAMAGARSLVIATGSVPGNNPLSMKAVAHEVDNIGTIKLIDAAEKTGSVKKIVLVSSILTNGRNWGQEKSPGFIITNAFGNVLDEKLVAENYLKKSGIDYTIVRPGGLKSKPPAGTLKISGEDTLNSGEISRDLVADVAIACLTDPKAKNKVLEIIENDGTSPKVFNGLNM